MLRCNILQQQRQKISRITLYIILMVFLLTKPFVIVTQAVSSNNLLDNVAFSVGQLNYEFTPTRINYELTLPADTKKLDVDVRLQDSSATYSIAGHNNIGTNTSTGKLVITVTAANGNKKWYTFQLKLTNSPAATTKKTTPITTTLQSTKIPVPGSTAKYSDLPKPDATTIPKKLGLMELQIKGHPLDAMFRMDQYVYSIVVKDNLEQFEVLATATDPEAMITVDQNPTQFKLKVSDQDTEVTYVVNLVYKRQEQAKAADPIIKNLIITVILFTIAIGMFILSRLFHHST